MKKLLLLSFIFFSHEKAVYAQDAQPGIPYVVLQYMTEPSEVLVTLNGFPVYNDISETGSSGGGAVNIHLKPTDNLLIVRIKQSDEHFSKAEKSRPAYSGQIQLIKGNEEGEPTNLVDIEIPNAKGEQVVEKRFDLPAELSKSYKCGETYTNLPVIDDQQGLRTYALTLLNLFKNKDAAALASEFDLKIKDTATAFGVENNLIADSFLENFANTPWDKINIDVKADDLVLIPWADGRIWEIKLKGDQPFISVGNAEEMTFMELYVARVDGKYRVAR